MPISRAGWEPANTAVYIKCLLHRLGQKRTVAEVLLLLVSIAESGPFFDLMWWLVRRLTSPKKVPPVFSSRTGFVNSYRVVDIILSLVSEDPN